jgi:hypothetical protein
MRWVSLVIWIGVQPPNQRALTVTLMDNLLGMVRQQLGLGAAFTLAHLLQGGTWTAGRKIAHERRPSSGGSPIPLLADGTVF